MSLPDYLRDRLYEAYSSSHAGIARDSAGVPAFKQNILPHLPADRRASVVDLGCGQGLLVRHLISLGFVNATGIDVSPEQVTLAHAHGVSQVELGDFRDSLNRSPLNAATGVDFFEHLTKSEVLEALDRVHETLAPGGVLVLQVPNSVSPFGGNYRHGDFTHETSYTARSLRQLGAAAGFRRTDVFACPPPRHGIRSFARYVLWSFASGVMKSILAAETGSFKGHFVTQNIVAVMTK